MPQLGLNNGHSDSGISVSGSPIVFSFRFLEHLKGKFIMLKWKCMNQSSPITRTTLRRWKACGSATSQSFISLVG
ncbi:hypothetical protein AAHC03_022822 [Spirometra sp. Aus1]